MIFLQSRLTNKLRISTGVLVVSMLAGSLIAYIRMREVSRHSSAVVTQLVPALNTVRDLRAHLNRSSSSLKSYLLFGVDPSLASRYKDEFARNWAETHTDTQALDALNRNFDLGADRARISSVLDETRKLETLENRVEQMAIGQGSDASGQAYDLLRSEVAEQESRVDALLGQVLLSQMEQTGGEMTALTRANHSEAVVLWTATLLGALLGGFFSRMLTLRIVRSIVQVANRAEAIADGHLMGDPLHMDSNDEVTSLARSVNRMQDNLREIIRTTMDTAAVVKSDSVRLTQSANESFQRIKEESLQTQQAATAMQEMSISIAEVSRHSQNAASNSKEAARTAREGGSIVDQMLTGMQAIADSVAETAGTVRRLGTESQQIIRIVNVIEEIAQKTNLLALNAAIEAARAGEQGRGFAVVAGEVRRLAENTRDATSEIAQMIEGIQGHTHDAVIAMDSGTAKVAEGMKTTTRAGAALKRIVEMADQVDAMIAQIATASAQQASAAQQSSENLNIISRLSEESAAAVPGTNAIVSSVEDGARQLQEHIAYFRLEETSISTTSPPTPPSSLVHQHAGAYGD